MSREIKWDRIGQINSNAGNGVAWYKLYDHPTPYSKSIGLALNAGEWKAVAMWHIKYKKHTKIKRLFKWIKLLLSRIA